MRPGNVNTTGQRLGWHLNCCRGDQIAAFLLLEMLADFAAGSELVMHKGLVSKLALQTPADTHIYVTTVENVISLAF